MTDRTDALAALGLFACAALVGTLYCVAYERLHAAPEPWTHELGAAVAFACGRGFADPGYAPTPPMAAFLDKTADRMSCDDLPRTATLGPPNFTQSLYRYMTLAVGVTWRLFGVSWASLSLLLGVLYGATAAVVYALFRLGAPRWPGAVGTALMIASPLQLRYLPQLRDYAKAPFMLALILTLALLVVRPLTRTRLLVLAAAYGAVTGVGF